MSTEALFEAIEAGDVETVRELIGSGVDVNRRYGIFEEPPLVAAADEESVEILQLLLDAGADPDTTNHGGDSALLEAARSAKLDMVELLIGAGARIDSPDANQRWTPLAWAVWWSCQQAGQPIRPNHEETVRALLAAGADPNFRDKDGLTPFMMAAMLDRTELADLLLAHGADPAAKDDEGRTAEAIASARGNRDVLRVVLEHRTGGAFESLVDAVEAGDIGRVGELLDGGADPNENTGRPAIVWAAEAGDAAIVDLLLERGAAAEPKGYAGESPLAAAARLGHTAIARRLVAAGAKPNVLDSSDETPLNRAAEHGDVALAEALLAASAKVSAKGKFSNEPLLTAASHGHGAVVEALIRAGANVHAQKGRALVDAAGSGSVEAVRALLAAGVNVAAAGAPALVRAVENGRQAVVALLVDAGVSPDVKTEYRLTALMHAAERGDMATVDTLIAAGAKLDAKYSGWTALHFAALGGHKDVARRLLDAGLSFGAKNRLFDAVVAGDTAGVRAALAAGAKPSRIDSATKRSALDIASALGYDEIAALLTGAVAPEDVTLAAAVEQRNEQLVERLIADGAHTRDARDSVNALAAAAELGETAIVRRLVEAGVDPNGRDARGKTALMRAAEEGHSETARVLLDAGADMGACDGLNLTPKDLAAMREHKDVVRLFEERARPPAPARKRSKALAKAVEAGDLAAVVVELEAGADPDAPDDRGMTPLLNALRLKRADMVEALLDAGARLDTPPNLPPIFAALAEQPLLELLLAAGADVNARDRSGQTPLMVASWRKHPTAALRLVAAGADVNALDDRGDTALVYACMHEQAEIVAALLDADADPTVVSKTKHTALYYAASNANEALTRRLFELFVAGAARDAKLDFVVAVTRSDVDAVRRALEAGASPKTTDPFLKWPALMWAALLGDRETVLVLVEAGAPVDVKKDRLTPLRLLWSRDDRATALDLVRAGADPNTTTRDGYTSLLSSAAQAGDADAVRGLLERGARADSAALYAAAAAGNAEIVRTLVGAGARVNAKDLLDRTPLVRALESGFFDVARLLIEAGAPANGKAGYVPLLSWAVATWRDEAFDLLLEHGSNPNLKDTDGDTTPHWAIRLGRLDLVDRLLTAGADPKAKNKAGRSPLAEAVRLGQTRAVEALLAAGTKPKGADLAALFDLAASEGEVDVVRLLAPLDPKRAAAAEVAAANPPDAVPVDAPIEKTHFELVFEDALMRGLHEAFRSRLPAESVVVYEGTYGSYLSLPVARLDATGSGTILHALTAWRPSRVDAEMAALGFARLGDLACDKTADVVTRFYVPEDGLAYGAFNAAALGNQSIDFVTWFEDGVVVSTTTFGDVKPMPARGLYPRGIPGVGISVLLHKHRARVARRVAAGAVVSPAQPLLEAAARRIDEFLVRRMGK